MSSSHMELEALLQSKTTAHEPEFKVALSRLSAEIKDRLNKGSPTSVDFFSAALRALSRMKGTAHADVRMTCLFDSGLFLFSNGYGPEALEAVRQFDDLARRAKKKIWIRKAQTLGGMIEADLGNVGNALIRFSDALCIAREIGDVTGEVSVFNNLGVALVYGGLYREAIPCLEKALELLSTDTVIDALSKMGRDKPNLAPAALTNLAQSYLYLEEFELGFAAISRCLEISPEPSDAVNATHRAIREYTYVLLALELGKMALAREHSKTCDRFGMAGGRRALLVADIARGLCDIHGGDAEAGLAILENARATSYHASSAREALLTALVKAYDQMGRPEPALECMNELLAHIRSVREKGILGLLSWHSQHGPSALSPGPDDLRALKHKEAQLRAKVAEREAVSTRVEMLERLAVAADLKEEASGEHGYRVGKLSSLLAEDLGWTRDACFAIDLAARLHDVGKIGVPDRILLNSQELKEAERHFMSAHAVIGAELLGKSNIPQLRMAEEIARHHHEWWDGTGYPSKLAGKRIPIHARIVALADVFDALTHGRPFAKPWPIDKALEEICSRRGTQFDPDLTDTFLSLIERLRAEHSDLDTYLGKAGRNSPFLQARNKIRLMLAEEREQERKATVSGNETRH